MDISWNVERLHQFVFYKTFAAEVPLVGYVHSVPLAK